MLIAHPLRGSIRTSSRLSHVVRGSGPGTVCRSSLIERLTGGDAHTVVSLVASAGYLPVACVMTHYQSLC